MSVAGARLWLVRHGETDWNAQRRVQGHRPTSLNEVGRGQARELAGFFAGRGLAAVWSSDLPRAYETAEIIVQGMGLVVERTERLRERRFGKFEGCYSTELHAVRTALGLEQTGDLADWTGMPGVETDRELWERSSLMLREISDREAGKDVLVVCHGGVMAQVVCGVLGIAGGMPRRFPMSNGMVVVLQWRVDAFYLLSLLDVPLVVGGRASVDTSAAREREGVQNSEGGIQNS